MPSEKTTPVAHTTDRPDYSTRWMWRGQRFSSPSATKKLVKGNEISNPHPTKLRCVSASAKKAFRRLTHPRGVVDENNSAVHVASFPICNGEKHKHKGGKGGTTSSERTDPGMWEMSVPLVVATVSDPPNTKPHGRTKRAAKASSSNTEEASQKLAVGPLEGNQDSRVSSLMLS